MGVSLNGCTPKTPQNDHFEWEKSWLLGTTILGNPHIAPTIQAVLAFSGAETEAMLLQLTRDVTPAVRGAAVSALGECPAPALWKVIWRSVETY